MKALRAVVQPENDKYSAVCHDVFTAILMVAQLMAKPRTADPGPFQYSHACDPICSPKRHDLSWPPRVKAIVYSAAACSATYVNKAMVYSAAACGAAYVNICCSCCCPRGPTPLYRTVETSRCWLYFLPGSRLRRRDLSSHVRGSLFQLCTDFPHCEVPSHQMRESPLVELPSLSDSTPSPPTSTWCISETQQDCGHR